jgi:N-acetylmuramoyl-L-alanine amidase
MSRFWHSLRTVLILLLFIQLQSAYAEKTTVRVQLENRPSSYLRSYDSLGVVYISVGDYASCFTLPFVNNPLREKIEVRLPKHRVKATAENPYLVITDVATNVASVYQLPVNVLFVDSVYYVPASIFLSLLERLAPSGISFNPGDRLLAKGPVTPAPKFDITGIDLEEKLNGYLLTIKASRKMGDFDAFLKPDGWLFVTVADAQADTVALSRFKPEGVLRRILTFQSPTSVQLTFQLSRDVVEIDPFPDEKSNDLLVALHTKHEIEKAELEKKQHDQMQEKRDKLELQRSQSKLDVIVIDAGHGGKDPGTIGVRGVREKNVTLGIALRLGRLIERNLKGVKVVYTRKTDTFVELDRRAQIANEVNGKLFVSIHCNSTERKPSSANGFEIYLLRPGKTESAIRIAERENAPITQESGYKERYKELTEENFILIAMRQSAFAKYSERFAEIAASDMAKHLKIQNSGVKQAGFYVLVGASMPNVLVETGYLSNRTEERILKSAQGQQRIAEALFQGIKDYKVEYERAMSEGRSSIGQGE